MKKEKLIKEGWKELSRVIKREKRKRVVSLSQVRKETKEERELREGLFTKPFWDFILSFFFGPFENHSVVLLDLSCEVHIVKSVLEYYKHLLGYVINGIRFLVDDDHFFFIFRESCACIFFEISMNGMGATLYLF